MPKAPLVLFGVEINLALYKAYLVNMAMFSNHPYSIICADALQLDTEKSGPSSRLWDLGQQMVSSGCFSLLLEAASDLARPLFVEGFH